MRRGRLRRLLAVGLAAGALVCLAWLAFTRGYAWWVVRTEWRKVAERIRKVHDDKSDRWWEGLHYEIELEAAVETSVRNALGAQDDRFDACKGLALLPIPDDQSGDHYVLFSDWDEGVFAVGRGQGGAIQMIDGAGFLLGRPFAIPEFDVFQIGFSYEYQVVFPSKEEPRFLHVGRFLRLSWDRSGVFPLGFYLHNSGDSVEPVFRDQIQLSTGNSYDARLWHMLRREPAVDEMRLKRLLNSGRRGDAFRALYALEARGADGASRAARYLDVGDETLRARAVAVLANDPRQSNLLLGALDDSAAEVRRTAAVGLLKSQDTEAAREGLRRILKLDGRHLAVFKIDRSELSRLSSAKLAEQVVSRLEKQLRDRIVPELGSDLLIALAVLMPEHARPLQDRIAALCGTVNVYGLQQLPEALIDVGRPLLARLGQPTLERFTFQFGLDRRVVEEISARRRAATAAETSTALFRLGLFDVDAQDTFLVRGTLPNERETQMALERLRPGETVGRHARWEEPSPDALLCLHTLEASYPEARARLAQVLLQHFERSWGDRSGHVLLDSRDLYPSRKSGSSRRLLRRHVSPELLALVLPRLEEISAERRWHVLEFLPTVSAEKLTPHHELLIELWDTTVAAEPLAWTGYFATLASCRGDDVDTFLNAQLARTDPDGTVSSTVLEGLLVARREPPGRHLFEAVRTMASRKDPAPGRSWPYGFDPWSGWWRSDLTPTRLDRGLAASLLWMRWEPDAGTAAFSARLQQRQDWFDDPVLDYFATEACLPALRQFLRDHPSEENAERFDAIARGIARRELGI